MFSIFFVGKEGLDLYEVSRGFIFSQTLQVLENI
jgi:hypothetical protein